MTTQELEADRLSRKLAAQQASQPARRFNYQDVAKDLDGALQPMLNACGAQTGYEKGFPYLLSLTTIVSAGTWQSIRFLSCGLTEIGWQPEFVYSVPPLARTLLDSLFNIIFMFDKPGENIHWFLAGGWCDQKKTHAMYQRRYGKDPEWKLWLQAHATDAKQTEEHIVKLSDEEKGSPKAPLKGYWPNPGRMGQKPRENNQSWLRVLSRWIRWLLAGSWRGKPRPRTWKPPDYSMQDPVRTEFLRYVNDWFYKRLSGDSHGSFTGLLTRGGHHLPLLGGIDHEELFKLERSNFVLTALTIYLALLSEIAGELSLATEKATLHDIWDKLILWPDAEDLYKARYDQLLK